jgi:hypothetical protein
MQLVKKTRSVTKRAFKLSTLHVKNRAQILRLANSALGQARARDHAGTQAY